MREITRHPLNKSPSKQTYSFSKTARFTYKNQNIDQIYNLPSTKSTRATSIGKANRINISVSNNTPSPGKYEIPSSLSKLGTSFANPTYRKNLTPPRSGPGPGSYQPKKLLSEGPKWSLNYKLKAKSTALLSKQKNLPGPGYYNVKSTINAEGKTALSTLPNIKQVNFGMTASRFEATRQRQQGEGVRSIPIDRPKSVYSFGKAKRLKINRQNNVPGPGAYPVFSEFGSQ